MDEMKRQRNITQHNSYDDLGEEKRPWLCRESLVTPKSELLISHVSILAVELLHSLATVLSNNSDVNRIPTQKS